MSVRRASTELLSQRFVHLHIVPRPANLSESREIYRVLQRFGDISKYYHLRFEYHNPAANSALVIYRDALSAQQALDASPIRFALEKTETSASDPHESSEDLENEDEDQTAPSTPTSGIDEILRPSSLLTRTLPGASPTPHPTPLPSRLPPRPKPFRSGSSDRRPLARHTPRLRGAAAVLEAVFAHEEHSAGGSGQEGAACGVE
ncbi:hypothetical protein N0V90_009378 [Kalmusia sp. IMI 367209]|nr:hypothetical protein N0V90_009378 [Kalmusia sp. IMI 367209]